LLQRYVIESVPAEELNDVEATAATIPFEVHYKHGQLRVVPTRVLDRETVDR